jgi:hypothetical protein
MQNVFRCKTHLKASEVTDAITQYLKLQHQYKPDLFPHWGFTKIELITRENNKKVYKAVTTQVRAFIQLRNNHFHGQNSLRIQFSLSLSLSLF